MLAVHSDVALCDWCGNAYQRRPRPDRPRPQRFCSKPCRLAWMNVKGERHFNWKGAQPKYVSIHLWVERNFGRQGVCSDCGAEGPTDWSNVDHRYRRV